MEGQEGRNKDKKRYKRGKRENLGVHRKEREKIGNMSGEREERNKDKKRYKRSKMEKGELHDDKGDKEIDKTGRERDRERMGI